MRLGSIIYICNLFMYQFELINIEDDSDANYYQGNTKKY